MEKNAKAAEYAKLRGRRDRRTQVANDLKETRERLNSGSSVPAAFDYELLAMFVRNEQSAAATIWALSAIFALSSMFWAPVLEGSLWLSLVIVSKVLLLELCRRFNALEKSEVDVSVWRRRFVLVELLNGLTWAGFALVGVGGNALATAAVFSSHVFIFATLIVVLSIRMTFAATVLPVLYAGTIPMTITVVGRLFLLNDPFYFALASMAIGVHVYFVFLAKGLRSTALAMLEFRAQKDELITELEQQRLISDEARRRAETANKAKSRFLATMSHELRTPLNAIMGFSEVMKTEVLGPMSNPTYRDYAENIHESGRHLLHLINEILDLSRIEAGRYELHEEPVRMADVAEDCHRLLRLKAQSKGLEIIEDIPADLPQVWVDQRAMRQICLNLMSNALKFTPKGGRITVTIRPTADGGQRLSVRDTGPGIPEDEIPKVLQAFGQGSLAHENAEGGTGLGLPIVQNLIELHGGSFQLRSELRKGTEAIVDLPKQRVLAQVAPLQPLGQERHRATSDRASTSTRQPRLRGLQPVRPAGATVGAAAQ
jgi:two-component system cell cycle sensor histidine kinase PleC